MLQIKGICKEYHTGSYSQMALDHIDLNLRDSEFVAILGPSGSGKTTLLNLIGGLDRYDSGDLVINGTSTKEYNDRDWDAYRNHSVGFIFQSYNLIPHQSILANVELALTIAGISKKERTRRAKEALERVGLGDHINKLPSQLSGGQMQRVAIARALINEPTVLLADEPTGALDSETSLQVMELLKEVAKDRLVVMVTHNPELARAYANRIVELRDGKITNDSRPFFPKKTSVNDKKRLGKASMSFFTALGLSFMNLKTKLSRTILVSFAGSIGIIGIALILALSSGTNAYIEKIQVETLSEYPITLQKRTVDLSFLLTQNQNTSDSSSENQKENPAETEELVTEAQRLKGIFSTAESNDLGSFKEYLEEHNEEIGKFVRSVEYKYSVTPLIFLEQHGRAVQVNPSKVFSALGFDTSLFSYSYSSFDAFTLMPNEPTLYEEQYDLKAGRWPKEYNELVLVLNPDGRVGDYTLYTMGLKDYGDLEKIIEDFLAGVKVELNEPKASFTYEDFLEIKFRLVNRADLFTYDEAHTIWTDRSEDEAFVKRVAENGEELKIVGVVRPKADATATMLNVGINYLPSLVSHVIAEAAESEPVKAQIADPTVNVLTGNPFEDAEGEDASVFSRLASLFSIDEDAIKNAFSFDESVLEFEFPEAEESELDLSELIDPNELSFSLPELSTDDLLYLLSAVKINLSAEELEQLFLDVLTAYYEYISNDPATDYARLPEAMRTYFRSDEAKELFAENVRKILEENSPKLITKERMEQVTDRVMSQFSEYLIITDAPDLDELIDRYHAGDAGLSDVAKYLIKFIPPYLATEEAQELLKEEIESLRAELTPRMISKAQISQLFGKMLDGYESYAKKENLPRPSRLSKSFSSFLESEKGRGLIYSRILKMLDTSGLEDRVSEILQEYSGSLEESLSSVMGIVMDEIRNRIIGMMTDAMGSLGEKIPAAFSIDAEAFASAIQVNMEDAELRSIISSLMSGEISSYESVLEKLGYADLSQPDEIIIYPKSFDAKAELLAIIDSYNASVRAERHEEKVIHYTDLVGTMMNSITDIINAVSYILIAFVSVSLVVSSIMIGVITYISVLERRKEIGILRAIGASKHNVASVFNAETFIIGALSGVLGITIAGLLLIPVNMLIHHLSGQPDLNGFIPVPAALLLILLSIVLTLIGGLIPSRSAAKSDPVAALRSE
ncbi:MAG: ABC transporter ATP-binding protein/permease [Clostridia bacterium]|nr:ABC transporter ATP-binding protein/permease [Clostridia bacterium]